MKNVKSGTFEDLRGEFLRGGNKTSCVFCFTGQRLFFFFFYLFISKKSWLFGSNSFLNSETETTKDYTVYKLLGFRNSQKLAKCFRIRRNKVKKFEIAFIGEQAFSLFS